MEYTLLEPSWVQEKDKDNMKEAIELIRVQIATNLMLVHNHFSDIQLSQPEDIYDYRAFDEVRNGFEDDFSSFRHYANLMRELEYNFELNVPYDDTREEYKGLEEAVEEKMRSI